MRPHHALPELDGWRAMRARSDDGAFESDERVRVAGPVVEFSEHGARVLADRYWLEVERVSRRVVRRRDTPLGLELRLFGLGPCLLSFGPPSARATWTRSGAGIRSLAACSPGSPAGS